MARYRLLRTNFTGTTQYFLAMFRGHWASSHGDGNGRQVQQSPRPAALESVDELRLRDEAVLDQHIAQPLLLSSFWSARAHAPAAAL